MWILFYFYDLIFYILLLYFSATLETKYENEICIKIAKWQHAGIDKCIAIREKSSCEIIYLNIYNPFYMIKVKKCHIIF